MGQHALDAAQAFLARLGTGGSEQGLQVDGPHLHRVLGVRKREHDSIVGEEKETERKGNETAIKEREERCGEPSKKLRGKENWGGEEGRHQIEIPHGATEGHPRGLCHRLGAELA
jgi:hypothetical protein